MNLNTTKGTYSLAALFELSKQKNGNFEQIKDIAARQDIPRNYLEQLLALLNKGGFVESLRGAKGGYRLAKPPSQIRIIDVLDWMEGPMTPAGPDGKSEVLQKFWKKAQGGIRGVFGESLEDLLAEERNTQWQLTYDI